MPRNIGYRNCNLYDRIKTLYAQRVKIGLSVEREPVLTVI